MAGTGACPPQRRGRCSFLEPRPLGTFMTWGAAAGRETAKPSQNKKGLATRTFGRGCTSAGFGASPSAFWRAPHPTGQAATPWSLS